MSGVSHVRGNPSRKGRYTGRMTWWLKLLIAFCKLWGSILMTIRSKVVLDTDTPAPRGQVCIPAGQLGTAFCVNCPTCMWALQLNTDLVYLIVTLAQNHILTAAQWYHEFLLLRLMCLFDLWDACSSFFSNRMQGLLQ